MTNVIEAKSAFKGVGLAGRFAIAGGLLAIALCGAFAAISGGQRHIQDEMESIVGVAQPMAESAFKMEIHTINAGLEVIQYLHTPDPTHRRRIETERDDFQRSLRQYRELAGTDRQRQFATSIEARHAAFASTSDFLMDAKDRTVSEIAELIASMRDFDRQVKDEFEAGLVANQRQRAVVAESVPRLKRAILDTLIIFAGIVSAGGNTEMDIAAAILDVITNLAILERAAPGRAAAVKKLAAQFDAIAPRMEALVHTQREIAKGQRQLIALRDEMDSTLNHEIQMLTAAPLAGALADVIQEMGENRLILIAALATLMAALAGISLYTQVRIVKPIRVLVHQADEIGRGNFEAATRLKGAAEVGVLARALAGMSAALKSAGEAKAAEAAARARMQEKLGRAERIASIGQLASGIAHNFNNMLMVANGYGDRAIKNAGDPNAVKKALLNMQAALAGATKLVRQLALFGGRRGFERRVFDVGELKNDIDTIVRIVAGENFQIEYDHRGSARVKADPGELTQAVLNLVTNAAQASSPGMPIRISVDVADIPPGFSGAQPPLKPGRYAVISVADRGAGIPASVLPRIFEPFFTTKAPGKGTGLGLAMVFNFAKESGGGVGITSEVGQGSTFSIYLPVTDLPLEVVEAQDAAVPRGRGESILLVDDDAEVLELTREVLTELGYVVHAASSGLQAIEIALDKETHIDLVVSDVILPGISGAEAYDVIAGDRPGLPVVFMSGSPEQMQAVKAPAHGRLLPKPVKTALLAKTIRFLLDHYAREIAGAAQQPELV